MLPQAASNASRSGAFSAYGGAELHQARAIYQNPIGSLVLTIYDENRLQVLDNLKNINPNARTQGIGNIANLQPPKIVHLFAKWSELRHAAWAYRNARDAYTRAANRMRVACEAVVLLRSGCDAGGLVSAVLELAT